MRLALKRLQSCEPLVPQPVLRQHTAHRLPQNLAPTVLLHQSIHGQGLEAAGARVVAVVHLLPHLASGDVHGGAVGHDNVVAAVGGRVPGGLVLAHEEDGDAGGEATQGWGCEAGRGRESLMRCRGGDLVPYS